MFVVTSEDVQSNQMNFSVAVLPSLGGRHLHDLGGPVLREKTVTRDPPVNVDKTNPF